MVEKSKDSFEAGNLDDGSGLKFDFVELARKYEPLKKL